jgi:hypothetical protein
MYYERLLDREEYETGAVYYSYGVFKTEDDICIGCYSIGSDHAPDEITTMEDIIFQYEKEHN